jgi:integrase
MSGRSLKTEKIENALLERSINMATVVIQKRRWKKSMSYSILYAHPITGIKRYYKTCKRYKEAQWEANELRALLDLGKMPDRERFRLNPLTFSEVAASLNEEWEWQFKRKELSAKTCSDYCIWLRALERTFGKRILCQISRDEILQFRDAEMERNSAISANKYHWILRAVLNHGMRLKAVTANAADDIPVLDEKSHMRTRFLLPKELNELIDASRRTRAKYYMPAIIYLGAEHGACRQEILDLVWSKINFDYAERGIIRIFRTKNRKERTEFLMPRTREALMQWRDHQEWMRHRKKIQDNGSGHVFCRLNGEPKNRFDKAWREACRMAGIVNLHFHDLRHTFCSNLLLSGAGLKDVKEMIGHSDISMTDRYAHLSLDRKLFWQEQLAKHYRIGTPRNPS